MKTLAAMSSDQRDTQTFRIIGAAMEVHHHLHRGYAEQVYREALAVEFTLRDIPFVAEYQVRMEYKGRLLESKYRLDFVCFKEVVVEVKGVSALTPADEAQLLNYLAVTKCKRGLLLNFGAKSLEYKRRVL